MELKITLKQHSPIIHFQSGQTGATLRATELKPKLDKYLKKKYSELNGKNLLYQVHIIDLLKNHYVNFPNASNSPYFGNMGTNRKKYIQTNEVQVKFKTFSQDLYDKIDTIFPEFLVRENFGTRSNKGYGCYFYNNKNQPAFEELLNKQFSPVLYWNCSSINEAFFSIKTVYSLLKSGINLKDNNRNIKTYYKSLLFKYFCEEKAIRWEKPVIKQHFQFKINTEIKFNTCVPTIIDHELFEAGILDNTDIEENIKNRLNYYYQKRNDSYVLKNNLTEEDLEDINNIYKTTIPSYEKEKYVRALLGVSDSHNYFTYGGRPVVQISDTKENFARIPSPIKFKIFSPHNNSNHKVYLFADEYADYEQIMGKEFKFQCYSRSFTLLTPDEFYIQHFLRWSYKRIKNLIIKNPGLNIGGSVAATENTLEAVKKSIAKL